MKKEAANELDANGDKKSQAELDYEAAKLACSIDNKDACVMCSG